MNQQIKMSTEKSKKTVSMTQGWLKKWMWNQSAKPVKKWQSPNKT